MVVMMERVMRKMCWCPLLDEYWMKENGMRSEAEGGREEGRKGEEKMRGGVRLEE